MVVRDIGNRMKMFHILVCVLAQVYCQALHVLLQYLMVANYFWMFCEGLHLHLALVVVFVQDTRAMRWFFFMGWGVPALLTALYACVRYHNPTDTRQYVLQPTIRYNIHRWITWQIYDIFESYKLLLKSLINIKHYHHNSNNRAN